MAPYRVGILGPDGDWSHVDCATTAEVRDVRRRAQQAGASHTIVSVPGEPEYDGDYTVPNGHIIMGRM